jgi:hypothetical protein
MTKILVQLIAVLALAGCVQTREAYNARQVSGVRCQAGNGCLHTMPRDDGGECRPKAASYSGGDA